MTSLFRAPLPSGPMRCASLSSIGLCLPGACGIVHPFPFVLLANISKSQNPTQAFLRLLPGLMRQLALTLRFSTVGEDSSRTQALESDLQEVNLAGALL